MRLMKQERNVTKKNSLKEAEGSLSFSWRHLVDDRGNVSLFIEESVGRTCFIRQSKAAQREAVDKTFKRAGELPEVGRSPLV